MFAPWYGAPGHRDASDWQALSVVDIFLAISAACGLAIFAITASQRTVAMPQAFTSLTFLPTFVGAVLAVYRTIALPGAATTRDAALWVGLVAALGLLVASWKSMTDERHPPVMRPQIEITRLPAPTPDGEHR